MNPQEQNRNANNANNPSSGAAASSTSGGHSKREATEKATTVQRENAAKRQRTGKGTAVEVPKGSFAEWVDDRLEFFSLKEDIVPLIQSTYNWRHPTLADEDSVITAFEDFFRNSIKQKPFAQAVVFEAKQRGKLVSQASDS